MFSKLTRIVGVLIVFLSFHFASIAQCSLSLGADYTSCFSGGLPDIQHIQVQATGYTSFQWSTSNGLGSLSTADTTIATYVPALADTMAGGITIQVVGVGSGCTSTSDQIVITFGKRGSVSVADKGTSTCSASKTLSATVTGFTSPTFTWNTNGAGTLTNTSGTTPTYTPTASERTTQQTVYFGLSVSGANGCSVYDSTFIQFSNQALVDVTSSITNVPCNLPFQQIPLNAQVTGDNAIFNWSGTGTGTFLNPTSANPIYQFTAADRAAGFIRISGAISTTSCGVASDTITINFSQSPSVSGNDTTVCTNSSVQINNQTIIGATSVQWSKHIGNGVLDTMGTYPIYYPTTSDVSLPFVRISVTASNNGCYTTDTVKIQVLNSGSVIAGINQTVCGITPILLSGQSSNTTAVNWSTSGTGFFNNGNTLNARYTPSQADVNLGSVLLALNGTSTSCGNITDSLVVFFGNNPLVNAGADVSVCGDSVVLIGSVENGSGASWSTSGTGTFFPNSNYLVTSYRFSNADKTAGSVTFTLTSASQSGCTTASDTKTVTIGGSSSVFVNAGVDKLSTGNAVTVNATASGATTFEWSTFGTGTFSTTTALSTVYTPSLSDVANGSVDLFITASSGVCGSQSDKMRIIFNSSYSISGKVTANGAALTNGFVALFRKSPVTQTFEVERIDSLFTNELGNYIFGMLPAGSYFVVAVPASYGDYYPTYNGNVASWTEATELVISNAALSNINIGLLPFASVLPNWNTGTDTLSGVLVSTTNTSGARLIGADDQVLSNAIVYLTNTNGDVITYTSTDKNGRFIFPNLISGNYMVVPEIAGATLLNDNTEISVDGSSTTIEGSSLVVSFPSLTTGVLTSTMTKAFQVYPNPTQEQIQFVSSWNGTTRITILNEMGMEMKVEEVNLSLGTTHEINLQGLSKGLYLIQCSNGDVVYQTKVVKQ